MGATNGVDSNEKDIFRALPDSTTLKEAGELLIQDEQGNKVPLKSIYTDKPGRSLVIFIRHFYCGSCEEYVRALARELPPAVLASTSTELTLIGCGETVCIPDYKERTGCPYKIYADPSRKIYKKLGMVSNYGLSKKRPEYITTSMVNVVLKSTWTGISSGSKSWKGGPSSQNGGEWLFQDGELKWCHRMENTSAHVEVKELKEVLGMQ